MLSYLSFLSLMFSLFLAGCIFQSLQNVKVLDFPEKLQNLRYTTEKKYLNYTAIYGGLYIETNITTSNINDKLSLLNSGYLDAIVMEYESITIIAGDNCDYVVSSKPFYTYFYGVQINPGVDSRLKTAIDYGLSTLVKEYDVENLKNGYFYTSNGCSSNLNSVAPVSMYQVFEIFILYTSIFVLGFMLRGMCNKRILMKQRNKYIEEIRELIARPESKILRITQNQLRNIESQCGQLLLELEKNLKRNNAIQERLINSVRAKEMRFR